VATSDIADYVIRGKAPARPGLGDGRPPASDFIIYSHPPPLNKAFCLILFFAAKKKMFFGLKAVHRSDN
jgi:hypothetical protein